MTLPAPKSCLSKIRRRLTMETHQCLPGFRNVIFKGPPPGLILPELSTGNSRVHLGPLWSSRLCFRAPPGQQEVWRRTTGTFGRTSLSPVVLSKEDLARLPVEATFVDIVSDSPASTVPKYSLQKYSIASHHECFRVGLPTLHVCSVCV